LNEALDGKRTGQKEQTAKKRAAGGLTLLQSILSGISCPDVANHYRTLVGETDFTNLCNSTVSVTTAG
jgi:hypothetical protein